MNRELDTFLLVAKDLLAEKHIEITQIRQQSDELIQRFGQEEYQDTLKVKTEFTGVFTEFVLGSAVMLNIGCSLAEAMAGMLEKADGTYDPFLRKITELCCEQILNSYISLDTLLD